MLFHLQQSFKLYHGIDHNHTGFLGRAEFYNALKLVTVAQSGRDLTPDIVRAALFGPAASKILAPQIASVPTAQVAPPPMVPSASFRVPQIHSSLGATQQNAHRATSQLVRPVSTQAVPTPIPISTTSGSLPGVGVTVQRPQISGSSTEWPGARIAGSTSVGAISNASPTPNVQIRGSAPTTFKEDNFGQVASTLQGGPTLSVPTQPTQGNARPGFPSGLSESKTTSIGGNGFSTDMMFGGDVFFSAASAFIFFQQFLIFNGSCLNI